MKLWNLSTFEQLQEPILQRNTVVEARREQIRIASGRSRSLKLVVAVTALTAATLTITAIGSSKTLTFPGPQSFVAANASVDEPPLEKHFANRYSDDWTKEHEEELLKKMLQKKSVLRSDEELLNVIHSSQQESISSNAPRIQGKEALAVLRRKA